MAIRSWLDLGRNALQAADWPRARAAFESALKQGETPEAYEGLAAAASWLDDGETVFRARGRAFEGYQRRHDRVAAARVAMAIGEDQLAFRGEPDVAREWHGRSAELLAELDEGPERGWLALAQGELALETRAEPALVRRHAEQAADTGRRLGLAELETVASALTGAAWVAEGRLDVGMRLVESAAQEALSGASQDHRALATTCGLAIASCNRARDYDRAARLGERAEELGRQHRLELLLAVCRAELAEVLVARGEWDRAERELEGAVRIFARARPAMRARPLIRLAALRRRQGWVEDARGILAEVEELARGGVFDLGLVPLEQAALALQTGDPSAAVALAGKLVEETPEPWRLDRFLGLEVLLRAHVALGDHARATAALGAMRAIAGGDAPAALAGAVHLGEGLIALAAGQLDAARTSLRAAVDLLERGNAAYDAARARVELARCFTTREQDTEAVRELERAWRALARMGLEAPRPAARASVPLDLSKRELEVLRHMAEGASNLRIAAQLHISEFTVKRHVQNILRKLDVPTRAAAAAAFAARDGLG